MTGKITTKKAFCAIFQVKCYYFMINNKYIYCLVYIILLYFGSFFTSFVALVLKVETAQSFQVQFWQPQAPFCPHIPALQNRLRAGAHVWPASPRPRRGDAGAGVAHAGPLCSGGEGPAVCVPAVRRGGARPPAPAAFGGVWAKPPPERSGYESCRIFHRRQQ